MNTTQLMAALLFISFPLTSQGNMLSIFDFFKKNEYVLSPEISGHLTQDGQAFSHRDVYLEGGFLKHRYNDKTQTDLNGYFHFEPMVHAQWLKKSPLNQAYSYIGIYILIENEKTYLWESILGYEQPFNFIKNNLNNLNCNISTPDYLYYFKNPVVPNGVDLMLLSRCEIKGYKRREKNQEE
ncbi:hypothetical protein QRC94_003644 [Vibrio vulnificus]|nr:hypothetical protein [Vibrio vulnificus]EJC6821038.1 hypothetical protein [Vibrio vulnificus]EJC6954859.1 hypothetical protein [Vibrio vulnificus]EJC6959619.1 hypothetical protein [Vibrio vulnificus]EKQ3695752.1 hypothetical protein [Vibrio vulnificus]